ncbi:hypothetical protein M422DRAFT_88531, partial [Sphaerobolus stellatus SS14]
FDPTRIDEIISKIEVGPDLTEGQRDRVMALVRVFADTFALSLAEVIPVDFMKHKLHVNPTATLPTKV